jgi:hypothetical protein
MSKLPEGMKPRNLWKIAFFRSTTWCLHVSVKRQRYSDLLPYFGMGGLMHRWWSWRIVIDVGPWTWIMHRIREKDVTHG